MKLKLKIFAAIFALYFSNYLTKSKYYDDSNKLVNGKIKDITGGLAIEEFVGLKPRMYSFLVDNSQNKKQKAWIDKKRPQNRNLGYQLSFIVLLWWQNIHSKQWIWWVSSWLPELIAKKLP